jgi:hypothetical protein
VFMNVMVWECCALDSFFVVFTTVTPLFLLTSHRLSLPIISLKMPFLSLHLNLLAKFSDGT